MSEYPGGGSSGSPGGNTPGDTRGFFGSRSRVRARGQARNFFSRIPGYDEIENAHDRQLADHYLWTGWFDPFATTDERNAARQAYYDISFTDGSMFPWNEWHREIYGESAPARPSPAPER